MQIGLSDISVLEKGWFAWRMIEATQLWTLLRPMGEADRLEALADPARFRVYIGGRPVTGEALVELVHDINAKLFSELVSRDELAEYVQRNSVNGHGPMFATEAQGLLRAIEAKLRVHLCYARDDRSYVQVLARRLVQDGVEPWLEEEQLANGRDRRTAVDEAVERSHAVIVCLSPRSVAKHAYAQQEIKLVLEAASRRPAGTQFVVPVRVEPCDVPETLGRYVTTNYYTEDGHSQLQRSLRRCAEALAHYPEPFGLKPA
jgi:hypothetical protein